MNAKHEQSQSKRLDPNKTIRARCRLCGHMWVVAYLPMGLDTAMRLMRLAACPVCGSDDPLISEDLFSQPVKISPGGQVEPIEFPAVLTETREGEK